MNFIVDQPPDIVFKAITNVRGWWTGEISGDADTLGGEFTYRYPGFHRTRQEVTELVPDRKLVWHVVEAENPADWLGTDIVFEIVPQGSGTEVRFTHEGLVPELECFEACSSAWGFYLNTSLRRLISTGEGPAVPPW